MMPQLGVFGQDIIDIDGHVGAVEGADAEVDDAGRDRRCGRRRSGEPPLAERV